MRDEIGTRRGRELRHPADVRGRDRRLSAGPTRWRCSGGCWPASAARTGRSSCTPGTRTLVGASPEVHVRMTGGTVVMNPISGTYRYPAEGPTAESLLDFLADRKEIEELSMVVDEELKMMCTVGDMGGVVVGPAAEGDGASRAHRVRAARPVLPRRARGAARRRCSRRRSPGRRCRTPAGSSSGTRSRRARLLRGRAGADRPRRGRRADPGLADPDPHRRHRRRRPAAGAGGRHAGARAPTRRARSPRRTRRRRGCWRALGVRPGRPPADADGRPRLADDPRVRAALDGRRADLAPFWLRMQEHAPTAELSGHALVVDARGHLHRDAGASAALLGPRR